MRKIILGICLVMGLSGLAQMGNSNKSDSKFTFSLAYDQATAHNYLFAIESSIGKNSLDWYCSGTFHVGYSHMDPNSHNHYVGGDGLFVSIGLKTYLDEFMDYGWNVQNAIEFASYNLSHSYPPNSAAYYGPYPGNADPGYNTLSFINPTVGYKFMAGKIAIEPYLGGAWTLILYRNSAENHNSFGYITPKFGVRIGFLGKS